MRVLAGVLLLALALAASAHHSRSHYSQDIEVLEGELAALHWVNPHVGLNVIVINGEGKEELWRVEALTNLVGMQKAGVRSDMFTIGEHVKIAGSPSVRRPLDFLATNFLLANGTEILLAGNVEPYFADESIEQFVPPEFGGTPVDAASANRGIFRVWSIASGGARTNFPFTEAAIAARAKWDPVANFAERCEPEGMPRIMRNPHPFEFVDDGSEITLISELYDLVRTIHMARPAPPEDAPQSPLGYSVGRWDENTLVVTTTHINWPYFDRFGTPQSEDVELVERFTISEDQTRLDYHLTITDPATFIESATFERYWLALGETIQPYNCQVY